jgi:hypothetical protein
MTISSLYHTQGIRGYKYQKTERTADTEIYYLHSKAFGWPIRVVYQGKLRLSERAKHVISEASASV